MTLRRGRLLAGIALLGAVMLGCGEDKTPAQEALGETEDHLGDIKSGRMELGLLASTEDSTAGQVGFLVQGRFGVGEDDGDLPVADLEYVRITDGTRRTTRFISSGEQAFVRLDGKLVELKGPQLEGMRVRDGGGPDGLEGLSLSDWVKEPRLSDGPSVDGIATRRLTGSVDAVPAINDLVDLAGGLGLDDTDAPQKLEGEAADRVRRAARGSTVTILSGKTDNLLRRLDLTIELSMADVDDNVRRALRGLAGAELQLKIDLTGVNEPVRVSAPG